MYTTCGRMAPDYDGDYAASEQMTPESRRRAEAKNIEDGVKALSAIIIEDNKICGMTELTYDIENPKTIYQGLTGVLEPYRGRGFGKFLKAALLIRMSEVNDKAEFIETGNNKDNIAMLAINKAMGFEEYSAHFLVTGDTEIVAGRLDSF